MRPTVCVAAAAAGGGVRGVTDIDACVWPSAPANEDCARPG